MQRGRMIVVRFVFAYMLVLVAVEFLLLVGGRASDRDFFLGMVTAVPVTVVCWMLAKGGLAELVARLRARAAVSRPPRLPAPHVGAGHHPAHGPSPLR